MTIDPFRDGRCSCASTVDIARAGLQGVELAPTCELHESDAIKAHKSAQEREKVQEESAARIARTEEILAEMRRPLETAVPSCSCDLRSDAMAGLVGTEVPGCAVHRPAPAPESSMALNSDPLLRSLEAHLGIPAHD